MKTYIEIDLHSNNSMPEGYTISEASSHGSSTHANRSMPLSQLSIAAIFVVSLLGCQNRNSRKRI